MLQLPRYVQKKILGYVLFVSEDRNGKKFSFFKSTNDNFIAFPLVASSVFTSILYCYKFIKKIVMSVIQILGLPICSSACHYDFLRSHVSIKQDVKVK
uniref:Uncharacterized protein n=1 Tax=Schistosoma haematobium TaxID=6185 RepID=A0A094ZU97_SCHHA